MAHHQSVKEYAIESFRQGNKIIDIGKELGIAKQTISNWTVDLRPEKEIESPSSLAERSRRERVGRKKKRELFIYLVREESGQLVKIGRTYDIDSRLKDIQTHCPQKVTLLGYFVSNDRERLETRVHRALHSRRVRGEWFSLSRREIAVLAALYPGFVKISLAIE